MMNVIFSNPCTWEGRLRKKVSTLIGYLLTDGLNCSTQIFSQLAFGIKGCSSKTCFISSIFRLLCIALRHYVRKHIIYTVYLCASVCLCISVMQKKKKSINILKNNGLFLKNKQKF